MNLAECEDTLNWGLCRVQKEVAQAQQIQERWGKRAQVADALDAVIDDITELTTLTQPVPTSPAEPQEAFWAEWLAQASRLEECVLFPSCSVCNGIFIIKHLRQDRLKQL